MFLNPTLELAFFLRSCISVSLVLSQESNIADFSVDWHFRHGNLPTAPIHLHTALLWAAGLRSSTSRYALSLMSPLPYTVLPNKTAL